MEAMTVAVFNAGDLEGSSEMARQVQGAEGTLSLVLPRVRQLLRRLRLRACYRLMKTALVSQKRIDP